MHGYQRAVRAVKKGKRWKPCSAHLAALAPHRVRSAGRRTRLQLCGDPRAHLVIFAFRAECIHFYFLIAFVNIGSVIHATYSKEDAFGLGSQKLFWEKQPFSFRKVTCYISPVSPVVHWDVRFRKIAWASFLPRDYVSTVEPQNNGPCWSAQKSPVFRGCPVFLLSDFDDFININFIFNDFTLT